MTASVKENSFKRAILKGEVQLGLWLSLCSNIVADATKDAGYDWCLVDMEHSPNEVPSVLAQLQAQEGGTCSSLVRPYWNDTVLVKRLLDIGAQTLLFPMVQNAEEAASAVKSTRYPPRGVRGVSMTQRGNRYGRASDYFAQCEQETCVLVQVETLEALENVEEIAVVDGVDGVFFGPADVAASMGKIGDINNQAVWDVIFEAAEKVITLGKPVGTLIGDVARIRECIDRGFTFIACGSDLGLVARGAEGLLANVRKG